MYNHRISNSDNVVGVNDTWQCFANVREESRRVWHWGMNYQRSSVKPKLASETYITLLNQEEKRKGWNSGQQLRQTLMWYVEEQKCVWRLLRPYLHCLEAKISLQLVSAASSCLAFHVLSLGECFLFLLSLRSFDSFLKGHSWSVSVRFYRFWSRLTCLFVWLSRVLYCMSLPGVGGIFQLRFLSGRQKIANKWCWTSLWFEFVQYYLNKQSRHMY